MITFIAVAAVATLLIVITPWIGHLNHARFHRTDQMAGDEGDD